MLATGHRENHRSTGANRPIEGVVCRRVARVEADDEVNTGERQIAGDVADLEAQPSGVELAGERLAVLDDIGLEIEADDLHLARVDDREEMVEGECQVRLARTEVDDPQLSRR